MEFNSTPVASSLYRKESDDGLLPKNWNIDNFENGLFQEEKQQIEIRSFMKLNNSSYFGYRKEEDIPKFYFPPINSLKLGGKGENSINEKYEAHSEHSQSSTKVHFTKESNLNFDFEFAEEMNRDIMVSSEEEFDFAEEPVKTKKIEPLPSLSQIFQNNQISFAANTNIVQSNIIAPKVIKQPKKIQMRAARKDSEKSVSTENQSEVNVDEEIAFITSKAGRHTVTAEKDLSKRSDVVNKTILRSMKRYYLTEFDSVTSFSTLSDKDKFAYFHELVRTFVTRELKSTKGLSEEEIEDTIFFFGSMISHIHMRRGIQISKQRTQVNFVHKCLYNYSHKKLTQLIAYGGFRQVLRDFVKFGGLEVVINSEETLSKNQDVYKKAADELFISTLL